MSLSFYQFHVAKIRKYFYAAKYFLLCSNMYLKEFGSFGGVVMGELLGFVKLIFGAEAHTGGPVVLR